MRPYQVLLFDVDDTLLDFQAAEQAALKVAFREQQLPLTKRIARSYHVNNQLAWQNIEKGRATREQWLVWRFAQTLVECQLSGNPTALDQTFRKSIAQQHQRLGASLEVVQVLSQQGYSLQIVSNGVGKTQRKRLAEAKLLPYFEKFFISGDMGVQKPDPRFFDFVFQANPEVSKEQFVIIGDSLTSDIQGGKQSGIDTVYLQPKQLGEQTVTSTFWIQQLTELPQLLATKSNQMNQC